MGGGEGRGPRVPSVPRRVDREAGGGRREQRGIPGRSPGRSGVGVGSPRSGPPGPRTGTGTPVRGSQPGRAVGWGVERGEGRDPRPRSGAGRARCPAHGPGWCSRAVGRARGRTGAGPRPGRVGGRAGGRRERAQRADRSTAGTLPRTAPGGGGHAGFYRFSDAPPRWAER